MAFVKGVKGMVQVRGQTYRIVRLRRGTYEVVRILDDVPVGTFSTEPKLEVMTNQIDPVLFSEIARSALMGGRLSWVGRLFLPKR